MAKINAKTTGGGGIETVGDASGVLELQSDGTTVINATTVSGNPRITGDFSNAAIANRVMFQTSTVNGNTNIHAIPNGTGTSSSFEASTAPIGSAASVAQLFSLSTDVRLAANVRDSGSYVPMTFYTGGSESMRIDAAGKIGMGMSAIGTVRLSVAADSNLIMIGRDSTGTTDKFRVFDTGNVQNTNNSYGAISDQNLKQDISNANSQWDDIKAIQVKNYRLIEEVSNDENAPTYLGVIAQDLESSGMGGLVEESPKELDDGTYSDTETTKGVKYSVLYMKALKALQEAITKIEDLETRIQVLENM